MVFDQSVCHHPLKKDDQKTSLYNIDQIEYDFLFVALTRLVLGRCWCLFLWVTVC